MPIDEASRNFVDERYRAVIEYYWRASRNNKKYYKLTRSLTIVLSALVTLLASLSAADYFKDVFLSSVLSILAPIFAAILTMATGFSQTFQWGAAWQDMVLTAEQLEKERDRLKCLSSEERNCEAELALLNDLVLKESRGFFDRMLGGAKSPTPPQQPPPPNP